MKNPNCRKSAQQHNFLHFSINTDTSQTHFEAFKSLTPMLLLFTDLIGTIITDLQSYLPLTFPQVFPIKNKTTSKTVTICLTKHFIIKVIWKERNPVSTYTFHKFWLSHNLFQSKMKLLLKHSPSVRKNTSRLE